MFEVKYQNILTVEKKENFRSGSGEQLNSVAC